MSSGLSLNISSFWVYKEIFFIFNGSLYHLLNSNVSMRKFSYPFGNWQQRNRLISDQCENQKWKTKTKVNIKHIWSNRITEMNFKRTWRKSSTLPHSHITKTIPRYQYRRKGIRDRSTSSDNNQTHCEVANLKYTSYMFHNRNHCISNTNNPSFVRS